MRMSAPNPNQTTEPLPEPEFETQPLQHSKFFELTFEMLELAKAFLRSILPAKLVERLDIEKLTLEPKQMFNAQFQEMRADVIYRVPIKKTGKDIVFFVVLEHKSYDDFWTILQIFFYVVHIFEKHFKKASENDEVNVSYRLSPIIAIIIHHGETRFTGSIELADLFYDLPEIKQYFPNMKAILFDLSTMDESEIPSDPNVPELKAVLTILKVVFSKDVGVRAKDVFEELKPYSEIPKYRNIIRMICIYLATSAKHLKNQYVELEKMVEPIVGEKIMSTLYERGLAEGTVKGKLEGKLEGEARGEVIGEIFTTLKIRFHRPVPQDIRDSVRSYSDLTALNSLAQSAESCESLDDFRSYLVR
jgi:predicted transposase YdaD